MTDNIRVMVRIRPPNQREMTEGGQSCVWISEEDLKTVVLDGNPKSRQFTFDWAGGPGTSQHELFDFTGRQMVDTCLEGILFLTRVQLHLLRIRPNGCRENLHDAGEVRGGSGRQDRRTPRHAAAQCRLPVLANRSPLDFFADCKQLFNKGLFRRNIQ